MQLDTQCGNSKKKALKERSTLNCRAIMSLTVKYENSEQ